MWSDISSLNHSEVKICCLKLGLLNSLLSILSWMSQFPIQLLGRTWVLLGPTKSQSHRLCQTVGEGPLSISYSGWKDDTKIDTDIIPLNKELSSFSNCQRGPVIVRVLIQTERVTGTKMLINEHRPWTLWVDERKITVVEEGGEEWTVTGPGTSE